MRASFKQYSPQNSESPVHVLDFSAETTAVRLRPRMTTSSSRLASHAVCSVRNLVFTRHRASLHGPGNANRPAIYITGTKGSAGCSTWPCRVPAGKQSSWRASTRKDPGRGMRRKGRRDEIVTNVIRSSPRSKRVRERPSWSCDVHVKCQGG